MSDDIRANAPLNFDGPPAHGTVIGWAVATWNPPQAPLPGWQIDWDGRVHVDRGRAEAELVGAVSYGQTAILVAVSCYPQREEIRRIDAVVEEAKAVIEAYDNAEAEADWTGALVDTRLRAAVEAVEGDDE